MNKIRRHDDTGTCCRCDWLEVRYVLLEVRQETKKIHKK